jgi:hypothetical protein
LPPARTTSGTSLLPAQRTVATMSALSRTRTTAGGRMPSKRRLKTRRAAS